MSGEDYDAVNMNLTLMDMFSDGCFTVNITDDIVTEAEGENFLVSLTVVSHTTRNTIVLLSNTVAHVIIGDNDGKNNAGRGQVVCTDAVW